MRALLSHRLNVFVVLPQSEDILKDTLKPFRFASALFKPISPHLLKKKNPTNPSAFGAAVGTVASCVTSWNMNDIPKYWGSVVTDWCQAAHSSCWAPELRRISRRCDAVGLLSAEMWIPRMVPSAGSFWGFSETSVLKSLSRELQVLKHSCEPEARVNTLSCFFH